MEGEKGVDGKRVGGCDWLIAFDTLNKNIAINGCSPKRDTGINGCSHKRDTAINGISFEPVSAFDTYISNLTLVSMVLA